MAQEKKSIVIKSTRAIGDMVIASALAYSLNKLGYHTGIISVKKALKLWDGIPNTSTFSFEEDKLPKNPVDLSKYLDNMPHSRKLSIKFTGEKFERMGHLCEWMAYSIWLNNGIQIHPSRDDVGIVLNGEEVKLGINEVRRKSKKYNKPVVILAPNSSTKNKRIPKQTLKEVIKGIWKFAVPCLLEDDRVEQYKDDRMNQYIGGAETIGDKDDLRKASAILYAADACVCVDSAPLHMINGAIQGTEYILDGVNPDMSKVVIVVGSSHPDVVSYKDNQKIRATGGCDIAPCGAHGYVELSKYEEIFGRKFYKAEGATDKSGCIFDDYNRVETETKTARCMEAVSAEEVIETVRQIILR